MKITESPVKVTEYPVHGINYYIAKIVEEDCADSYLVEIYLQDQPKEAEENDWPTIIRWILWIFDDPYREEEDSELVPLISRRFPYSVDWVNAINKLIWEYERPIRYRNQLFEWDGQVFEPPKPSPRPAPVQTDKEEPHLEYEEQEIEVKDQDNSKIIRQKIPRLVGKKPSYMKTEAWLLMQEEKKRSRNIAKKAQGGSG